MNMQLAPATTAELVKFGCLLSPRKLSPTQNDLSVMSCCIECKCRLMLLIGLLLLTISGPVLAMCPANCGMCPCFTQPPYSFPVDEDAAVGTLVATVTATNPAANTGTLSYSIEDSLLFVINSTTAAITLGSSLDYESETLHEFTVKASASNYDGRVTVMINVQNRNDIFPHCSPTVLHYSVEENQPNVGFPLSNCIDNDFPLDPNFTYSLNSFNHLFHIDTNGFFNILQPLNYEDSTHYDVVVTVSDNPIPPGQLNTTIRVILLVQPVNEFAPVFDFPQYVFTVSEDADIGSVIGSVLTSDADSGADGVVSYHLTQSIGFSVDRVSGDVVLASTLDYETEPLYMFNVTAMDGATHPRSSYTTVRIDVTDSNDNSPVFQKSLYYLRVSENTNPNTYLLTAACSDLDSGAFGENSYSIVSGNADSAFIIDSLSGNVSLAQVLNYDEMAVEVYNLVIRCEELAHPNRAAEALILVEVVGFNQFSPQTSATDFEENIREDSTPGTVITTISASDRDRGIDGLLHYFLSFSDSCPSDVFFIDENTGAISLLSYLDYENGPRWFYCLVTISDSGSDIKSSEVDLDMLVTNVNDESPRCFPAVNIVSVQEDSSVGTVFYSLYCNDSDSRVLAYSINQSLPFDIDSIGQLRLSSGLNYETVQSFHFSIQVSDGEFTTAAKFAVYVENVNEFSPEFLQDTYHCTLYEDSTVGTSVGCDDTITAVDQDAGSPGLVRYRLEVPSDFFSLSLSGDLELTSAVDRETQSQFSLIVVAFDLGDPSLSSSAVANITVLDVNDNPPDMVALVTASVTENSPSGLSITQVICTDVDHGINGAVQLSVISAYQLNRTHSMDITVQELFTVHPATGNVTLAGSVDYESARYFRLLISCTDGGTPALSSQAVFLISILPVNEFVPEFTDPLSSIQVRESTEVGAVLFTMYAVDHDSGNDRKLKFSLSTTSSSFDINDSSGQVILTGPLNCETEQQHVLVITVSDNGLPVFSSQAIVTVNISECFLGQIIAEQSVYSLNITENASIGESVGSVLCLSTRNMVQSTQPHYQILSDDQNSFAINLHSGELTLTAIPDYEAIPVHSLKVQCLDPSHQGNSVNVSVYVAVLPVNEFAPTFPTDVMTFNISEDTSIGEWAATLLATDGDDGLDGELVYSMEGEGFVLNENTGEVYLTTTLDRELQNVMLFNVTATDKSPNPASRKFTQAAVVVSVTDVNDNSPLCTSVLHVAVSPYATVPKTLLSQFNCTDIDIANNAELHYRLGSEVPVDSPFVISDGGLVMRHAVDISGPSYYRLPIVAADKGNPPRSTHFLIVVHVQEPEEDENTSLVEAEGIRNSVTLVLKGVTASALDSVATLVKLREVVAASVTSYCSLLPGACSLASTCSELYTTRRKRDSPLSGYPSFSSESVVIHKDPGLASVVIYVRLPVDADKAHSRVTNYVVPESTLSLIVEQDGGNIQALVRDAVNQTPVQEWMIVLAVIVGVVGGALAFAIVTTTVVCVKRQLKRRKDQVVPINPRMRMPKPGSTPESRISSKRVSLTSSLSDTSTKATCNASNKKWTLSGLASLLTRSSSSNIAAQEQPRSHCSSHSSARSTNGICSGAWGRDKVPDVFFSPESDPDDLSELSLGTGGQGSGGTSLDNFPSPERRNNGPRTLVNALMKQNS